MPLEVRQIGAADVPAVAAFLNAHLNSAIDAATWARSMAMPWMADPPNHGFLLADADGAVVGAYLAVHSERTIGGRVERFCNMAGWCVHPDHRFHALKLLKAMLAQDDCTFTDLSPSGSVPAMNKRLGFEVLDTTSWLVPSVPLPTLPGRGRVISRPDAIERALSGRQLEVFRDHRDLQAARHVVLRHGDDTCYVIFRKERLRGRAVFASLLHVSDPVLLRRLAGPLARHMLLRHGVIVTIAERRIVRTRPRRSLVLRKPRTKMFRSPRLDAAGVDYLYSELVCLEW